MKRKRNFSFYPRIWEDGLAYIVDKARAVLLVRR